MVSTTDLIILAVGGLVAFFYLFKDIIFASKSSSDATSKIVNGSANADQASSGDFVSKLVNQKKRIVIFYGSQTGTAEEYATKLAKEAKARFGTSSLVCDPEEYEFEKLDQLPEDCVAFFVMATYGEGEPTDNAVGLMEFISDDSVNFSNGDRLENLNYVVFGLGNRTYEHYNEVARKLDARLTALGAKRIGERGEGDDDKSMEEDYLAWKDGMFETLASTLNFEEGGGGDVADFKVTELESHPEEKVYKGELSARALLGTKGIHDAKNPYCAVVTQARELFVEGTADRTCVHMEFDIEGSGISYQHGDHLAVWAHNPEKEVDRMLAVLGLLEKRHNVIDVESLDPTLAKVPFPSPTTYEAVFRHYLDITAHAGRQTLSKFAKYAPSEAARLELERIGSDKAYFQKEVADRCLKVAEVLQLVAGDDLQGDVAASKVWNIPFDRVISDIPRVGPRFYSISSSPKLYPKSVHITAVVLRYTPKVTAHQPFVHGLATNFISSIKMAKNQENATGPNDPRYNAPRYELSGPRGAYTRDGHFRTPIHIRRSNFRLPTSPKIPVIMVGPGTGVAPFRSFVQERTASADKAREKNGSEALKDWGNIWLFYGCRKSNEDFLYKDEWPDYASKLDDKFKMEVSLSREKFKPDGSKIYVQDLIWERRKELAEDILERKAYIYICGEAKGMAHDVEDTFIRVLDEARGAGKGKEEIKVLKERGRMLLDVWS
ncbi:putative NADPH-cytochrome P450 reductase [Violaceomyces palustris]|uniref:NADPH-cytochrome P450 reductase n=1 Tax=Violaceomyces palustris TaxID=1673888 RepID=A0ACD0P412_9BASI|nr:putative NADPH-cytochrome P450 reductase [Violaceomyces palustris]